jgi:hypothetical protein
VSWAIVIGIDHYGDEKMWLSGAVADAVRFRDWVVSEDGGKVSHSNLRLLLGRHPDDPNRSKDDVVPTKDNIVTAINDVITANPDGAERLYFYFSGHGITARVANRDEGALVTPGFDEIHTDHSLSIRSLAEHFETTQFKDQFFFLDACRNIPWENREFEIGRWPIPRRRDPGQPPVQQFILYATSPGLTAAEEVGWVDEAGGAFTDVLMKGLIGDGQAKAWSWERNCYEVRWERLATYVNAAMAARRQATKPPAHIPAVDWPIQIPQDAGSRGVADRDRDALLVSFARGHFGALDLTLSLEADPRYKEAQVSVLDALGEPVASALKLTDTSVTFTLPPKTYAVRATTLDERIGFLKAPIELYEPLTKNVPLRPRESPRAGEVSEPLGPEEIERAGREEPPGVIEIHSRDPLAVAEIRDEAGRVVAVKRGGDATKLSPGFYRVRHVGPEEVGNEQFVVLAGELEPVRLEASAPAPFVVQLAEALGGRVEDDHVTPVGNAEAVAWAQPSTIVLAGVGAALHDKAALEGLGLESPRVALGREDTGVAVYAVAENGDAAALEGLGVRIWPAGESVTDNTTPLRPTDAGVAAVVTPADEVEPHWVSLERDGVALTVVAVPVLPGRLATLVVQVDADRVRMYQFHPVAGAHASSHPDRLRRVEHLQRLLLAGRLDGAEPLARELATGAPGDPFAGCLAGYVLLRLGLNKELGSIASAIAEVAPKLSDAYILRGEDEASKNRLEDANQAFADAVSAGIPAFGEGLTRLVEGLRVSGFNHPRGAIVRYIFQRHARGIMWAAFTPHAKALRPGRLVITAADVGFEA